MSVNNCAGRYQPSTATNQDTPHPASLLAHARTHGTQLAINYVRRLLVLMLAMCATACKDNTASANASATATKRPMRIVSLDFCADQYVLKMVERDRILALSPDANKDFSYMRDHAADIPSVRPIAENILILKPDLIVRSYGGGPHAQQFFEQADIPVLNVGWASTLDSETRPSVTGVISHMARGLGAPQKGAAIIADFRARLAAIPQAGDGLTLLYMTRGGATTGPGSLVHEMIIKAGLENFEEQPGWRSVPLEKLAYNQPESVATAFYNGKSDHPGLWSASRHPIAKKQMQDRPVVDLEGAWLSCGAWFAIEAVEALAAVGKSENP